MKQFSELDKILKRVNKEKFLEAFVDACENFSMTDSIPDAEEHVESVKEQAQELKEKCQIARNNLDELIQQLDSLSGVEVISDEGSNGSSDK
jgi:tellurite resistance protein